MELFDFNNPLYEVFAGAAVVALLVLAVLTLRSVSQRDRAMTFGKADRDAETRRANYERRWRSGGLPAA